MNPKKPSLKLNKETLRRLDEGSVADMNAGMTPGLTAISALWCTSKNGCASLMCTLNIYASGCDC